MNLTEQVQILDILPHKPLEHLDDVGLYITTSG